ncbi:MAG TPA: nucleotide exchange factor GrpE [Acholeplasmataceae bacterium]|jgi:molecular chaperone GrpE|nr:nucleotide exchange factor GrpE [Acholeplasmataceae bacterium]
MSEKKKPEEIINEEEKKETTKISEDDTITISSHKEQGEKKINVEYKKGGRKVKIKELEDEIESLKNDLLRNQADFENFKKRMHQERITDRKYAAMDLIHDLLIPLDQLRKVVNMDIEDPMLKNYLIGFKMINDQIYDQLEANGLKEIKALGETFDPKVHHAVEKDSNSEIENNIITEEIQKGYMYKDRILRPAMVKVNEWSE